jgi:hypothetical protein
MVRRGSDPCGCPSWSGVDPTVIAVAEAMAKRDGYRLSGAAGVLKNFLPLAEAAVSEVRRLDGLGATASAAAGRVVTGEPARAVPVATLAEPLAAAATEPIGATAVAAPDSSTAGSADALRFRLVASAGSRVLPGR